MTRNKFTKPLLTGFFILLMVAGNFKPRAVAQFTDMDCAIPGYMIPYEQDCRKYYYCLHVSQKLFLFECSAGLAFDQINQICNWPWSSKNPYPPCDSYGEAINENYVEEQ